MNGNFEQSLAFLLKEEGGYTNNPHDKGGMTNLGVTHTDWGAWIGREPTEQDMRGLTPEKVAPLYKQKYWDAMKCDDLPVGVDYAVFDFGVNSGTGRSARYIQSVCGATQDGIIGPQTLAAVKSMDPIAVIDSLCDKRLNFLQALSDWQYFGNGWGGRVERVRQRAKRMVSP
jgi:lysozyme family protein